MSIHPQPGPEEVRPAGPADAAAVLDLLDAFYRAEGFGTSRAEMAPVVNALLAGPGHDGAVFLAVVADRPVAVAVVATSLGVEQGGRFTELTDLYVQPEHRGRGLGRELVEKVWCWCRDRGHVPLEVVVTPESQAAHDLAGFYGSLGFRPTGRTILERVARPEVPSSAAKKPAAVPPASPGAAAPVPGVRPVQPEDTAALMKVIAATGLFPSNLLPDMLASYFQAVGSGDGGGGGDLWLTDENKDERVGPIGVAYAAPERMTQGTWNLYLIAVHPDYQGQGRGTALAGAVERTLRERGQRVLLVETSGLPAFERTRAFYRRRGYEEEARVRDFYQSGEDKVTFRKVLAASARAAL